MGGTRERSISLRVQFRGISNSKVYEFAKGMKKNAKLASLQTSLRHVAIFLHNANFLYLRVTNSSPNSPERDAALRWKLAVIVFLYKGCYLFQRWDR